MKVKLLALLFIGSVFIVVPLSVQAQKIDIRVDSQHNYPEWALLQRELIRSTSNAAEAFFSRYFDDRGYLKAETRWGGNDGPDDAIENVSRWPQLHALGGSNRLMKMTKKAYEGHVRQMSEPPKTSLGSPSHIPYIRDGMYYKEFPTKMDWVHNSEGIKVFTVMGLGDPNDLIYEKRVRRFAGLYMNEDPGAPNYDSEHKIIRSMFNGSRGPLMRKTTAVDWAGDPTEVRNRYATAHGEANYEEFLYHFKNYYNTLGDHPLNLLATTLSLNSFILTGDEKYRDWTLEYVDAWYNRMEDNDWLIPSNVGLDGTIGGETDGKWYGGTYGWSFTRDSERPPGSGVFHINNADWGFVGFMNAYMLTRDDRYLEAWRKQDDIIYDAGRMIEGEYHTPRMYGNPDWSREGYTDDDGWYNFREGRDQSNKLELYYLSWKQEDRERIEDNAWLDFIEGNNPNYAVNALRDALSDVNMRMQTMRDDTSTFDTRLVDNPINTNPASGSSVNSLIRLMGGGIYMNRRATVHFTRLRYFDPEQRRAGVPEDVAALVDRMSDDSVRVKLVNLNPVEARILVVQGGAYGEHQIVAINRDGERTQIDNSSFQVLLEPGSGTILEIEMDRYANQPTMNFPWRR